MQPAAQRDNQLDRDLRVFSQQPAHVGPEDRDCLRFLERLHGRRARLVAEHRELPEDLAGAEAGQGDRTAVGVLQHRARVTGADHVAGVAGVALAEHHLGGAKPSRHRELGHLREVFVGQRLEQRDLTEQLGSVLTGRRHQEQE